VACGIALWLAATLQAARPARASQA
jgi:hypothetical protein